MGHKRPAPSVLSGLDVSPSGLFTGEAAQSDSPTAPSGPKGHACEAPRRGHHPSVQHPHPGQSLLGPRDKHSVHTHPGWTDSPRPGLLVGTASSALSGDHRVGSLALGPSSHYKDHEVTRHHSALLTLATPLHRAHYRVSLQDRIQSHRGAGLWVRGVLGTGIVGARALPLGGFPHPV